MFRTLLANVIPGLDLTTASVEAQSCGPGYTRVCTPVRCMCIHSAAVGSPTGTYSLETFAS